MKKTAVSINRLEIRLKGMSPQTASGLVDGLGDKLMMQLTRQHHRVSLVGYTTFSSDIRVESY